MPAHSHTFDHAVIRVVPRVERGERMNVGIIVYCRQVGFLGAEIALDRARLCAFAPALDIDAVADALAVIPDVCAGTAAGPVGRLAQAERFHWLCSPRSTVIQVGRVHSGLCDDPAFTLQQLVRSMVL